jgi:rare lipoprotein A
VSGRAAHLLGFRSRGTAWVRVEYVGRAPIEGSDDRLLEATLRQNAPAPPPGDIRLAGFPAQPPPVTYPRLASAAVGDDPPSPVAAQTVAAQTMSFAGTPDGVDGTAQFLNGRGLY